MYLHFNVFVFLCGFVKNERERKVWQHMQQNDVECNLHSSGKVVMNED